MKKLSIEEAKDIIPIKKGKLTWLTKMLATLKVGEGIIITKAEWKGKKAPYNAIRKAAELFNMEFDYGQVGDGSGWVAKRTK